VTAALEPNATRTADLPAAPPPPSDLNASPDGPHLVPSRKRTWRPASEIAVDLGTANTLVLVKGEGVVLNEPSVAAVDQATGEIMGIGLEAKRMLGRTPEGILAVRPMKDGVIANFEVAEKMLRHFLRAVLDRRILRVKPTVIVCVPSGITEVERRAVRDSAQSAGVKRLLMVAEPMAAAIGVGLPVDTPSGNMVVDIGGGTTNVAVIALSGIVCDASIRTGGDELDQAIVQFMRKNYSLLIGEPTAEMVKITIGSAAPLDPEVEMEVKGRDPGADLPDRQRGPACARGDPARARERHPGPRHHSHRRRRAHPRVGPAAQRGDRAHGAARRRPPHLRSAGHRPDPRRLRPLRKRADDVTSRALA
jgi:rod shape-determining protein MreB